MFTVYVLKSLKNGKRYVGHSGKSALVRLKEHNSGSNQWTRVNKPFMILREEGYVSKTAAIKRERFLKSGQGRKFLDEIEESDAKI
jgi:putative endonuclease